MRDLAAILSDWPLWGLTNKPIESHQLKPLSGGLTNLCYQLSLDSGDYILRISAHNTNALGINRPQEKRIHQFVAEHNFTSPLRYCADDNSYWIRDYIVGEVLSEAIQTPADMTDSLLAHMVEYLKSLHQLPPPLSLKKLNISTAAEPYWQMLKDSNPSDELLKMKPLMQVAMNEPPAGNFCLCHMDTVLANWLYTAQGLQLLDWEYAGLGHPLWDLAAFWQGIKQALKLDDNSASGDAEAKALEEKIMTLYGVKDLTAWRRANIQMEYLSSLWYRAQT